jgi:hypothetical protein
VSGGRARGPAVLHVENAAVILALDADILGSDPEDVRHISLDSRPAGARRSMASR